MAENNKQADRHQAQTTRACLDQLRESCLGNRDPEATLRALDALEAMLFEEQTAVSESLAVQMSLYPLRQPRLSPVIHDALSVLAGYGLQVIPGAMSSILIGPSNDLFTALQEVYHRAAAKGDVVMILTLSNACPAPETAEE